MDIVKKKSFKQSLPLKFSILSVQQTWALYAVAIRWGNAVAMSREIAYST